MLEEKDIGFGMVDAKKDAKVAKKLGKQGIIPNKNKRNKLLIDVHNLPASIPQQEAFTFTFQSSYNHSFTHSHNESTAQGDSRLVRSSQGEASRSGTPLHSARRSRRSSAGGL